MPRSQQPLSIQVAYFHEDDRTAALALGERLYDRLTRSRSDPLAFGPKIPVAVAVRAPHVDLDAAEQVLVVPVLDEMSFFDEPTREDVLATVKSWHEKLGSGHVVPIFVSANWRNVESELPGKPSLKRLYSKEGPALRQTVIEVVLAAVRLFTKEAEKITIFVSHAKADLPTTRNVADKINAFAKTKTTGAGFLDATDLLPGEGLAAQLEGAASRGVFLSVRSDAYASRAWCQREVLWAKRAGVPILVVEMLRNGEPRSFSYSGNAPTEVWPDPAPAAKPEEIERHDAERLEVVVERAFVELLRSIHFEKRALSMTRDLPASLVLNRPPELLDVAQGPLGTSDAFVVVHPDPELTVAERQVLRQVRPRLHTVTPSTFYRGALQRASGEKLDGATLRLFRKQIAMALSDSPDAEKNEEGYTPDHVKDAVVGVSRNLLSAGACIAYGGDHRMGGFDELLSQLVIGYNASDVAKAEFLHSYLAAHFPRTDVKSPVTLHWLQKKDGSLPWTADTTPVQGALHVCDMRRLMAERCFARIAIGGQARPKSDAGGLGYGGPYPGVVEEAWWFLFQGKPLYVVGAFGGASLIIAQLLRGERTPLLESATFAGEGYGKLRALQAEFASHAWRTQLGLPATMEDLADDLRKRGAALLASDEAAMAFNGLTVAENRELFTTRDVDRISELIMSGLFRAARPVDPASQLRIELVHGSLTQVEKADAVAVATFSNVPMGGAGAALDRLLSDRVSAALRNGEHMVSTPSGNVDCDWLILEDLGAFDDQTKADLPARIERAATHLADVAVRHGFRRVGLVSFGGNVVEVEVCVEAMLEGLRRGASQAVFEWFERNQERFDRVKKALENVPGILLGTRVIDVPPPEPKGASRDADVIATIRYEKGTIFSTVLLPAGRGGAAALARSRPLDAMGFETLARPKGLRAPSMDELTKIGSDLAELLFEDGVQLLERMQDCRLVIQHDPESAGLPFEALAAGAARLAAKKGVLRRPALPGLRLCDMAGRPAHRGSLRVGLIVNPTKDLDGAETEAKAVKAALAASGVSVHAELWHEKATREAILDLIADPSLDVLHYCGHAFFEGVDEGKSGLYAHGSVKVTSGDVRQLPSVPRLIFFNACQSARVRKLELPVVARAFAEQLLRSPVEGYVGTLWPVLDDAAAEFATQLYTALGAGATLDQAMAAGRAALLAKPIPSPDWANYVLYGDGSFVFVKKEASG